MGFIDREDGVIHKFRVEGVEGERDEG